MTSDAEFWSNRFHWCALAAGFLAASEGRLDDTRYVQELAHHFFDSGAFKDRMQTARQADLPQLDKTLTMTVKCANIQA